MTTTMSATPVSVLGLLALTALACAAPMTLTPVTVSSILSLQTGRFLKFSSDGNIYADGEYGKFSKHLHYWCTLTPNSSFFKKNSGTPETALYIKHFPDGRLRIQSLCADGPCFLIFENGTFQSGLPSNSNDVFEVQAFDHMVAFRVIHSEQQSGSGEDETSANGEVEKKQVQMSSVDEMNNAQMESDESHDEAIASDCYLGFEDATSGPKCYGSTDSAATRFIIIELFS